MWLFTDIQIETFFYMFFGGILVLMIIEKTIKHLKKMWGVKMWEILIPASNRNQEFTYEHHKKWDEFVIMVSGGITIMRTAKGQWVSPDNVRFKDRMIPVRIKCTRKQIKRIIKFTISHYNQEAVIAYKISDDVILLNRNKFSEQNN